MTELKAKTGLKSVNISLNPQALSALLDFKKRLSDRTGLNPTYSEVILYLIKNQK